MAAHQLKRKSVPYGPHGEADRDAGNARVADVRFEPDRILTQFDFAAPADPAAEYWRAVAVLTVVAIAVLGAIAGIAYFAGMVAAAIATAAVAALIGFGNWVLNNTVDLP
ncbi:MAG TPA: hypothetical protein VKC17_09205 [Sphingomicrobium sp.]|nr:hypothetical protein [Sphingomicrobium sp.]